MTNKSSFNRNTGVLLKKAHVQTLELQLDPPPKAKQRRSERNISLPHKSIQLRENNELPNTFIPFGARKGTKYPVGRYTYNKSSTAIRDLKDDVNHLIEHEKHLFAPEYAIDTANTKTISGESPLFQNKLLAPNRIEQKYSPEECDYINNRNKLAKRSKSAMGRYCRIEMPHEYLHASGTSVLFHQKAESNATYSRPTKTTILRENQQNRCKSAPVNIYKMRKEMKKQHEQTHDTKKVNKGEVNIKNLIGFDVPPGESVRGFLIGARYNRSYMFKLLNYPELMISNGKCQVKQS